MQQANTRFLTTHIEGKGGNSGLITRQVVAPSKIERASVGTGALGEHCQLLASTHFERLQNLSKKNPRCIQTKPCNLSIVGDCIAGVWISAGSCWTAKGSFRGPRIGTVARKQPACAKLRKSPPNPLLWRQGTDSAGRILQWISSCNSPALRLLEPQTTPF